MIVDRPRSRNRPLWPNRPRPNAAGAAVDFAAQLIAALKGEGAADAVLEAVHA